MANSIDDNYIFEIIFERMDKKLDENYTVFELLKELDMIEDDLISLSDDVYNYNITKEIESIRDYIISERIDEYNED